MIFLKQPLWRLLEISSLLPLPEEIIISDEHVNTVIAFLTYHGGLGGRETDVS